MWIIWHAYGAQQGWVVWETPMQYCPAVSNVHPLYHFSLRWRNVVSLISCPLSPSIQPISMCIGNKSRNALLLCRIESCCSCLSIHASGGRFVLWEWQLPGLPVSLGLHVQWWPAFVNEVADTLAREIPESGTHSKALWLLSGQCCWCFSVHFSICVLLSTQYHYKWMVREAKASGFIYFLKKPLQMPLQQSFPAVI